MKVVSFEVAKAIKEAGYPQAYNSPCYITEDCIKEYDADYDGDMPIIRKREYKEGQYINIFTYNDKECNPPRCYAPTYLEVWLWLWKENGIPIQVDYSFCGIDENINDPEEAIITAIEHLVKNDLIK